MIVYGTVVPQVMDEINKAFENIVIQNPEFIFSANLTLTLAIGASAIQAIIISATDRRKGAVPSLFSERRVVPENSVKTPVPDITAPCAPLQIAQETCRRRLPAEA